MEAMLVDQFALLRMNTVRDKGHGNLQHGEQRRESTRIDGRLVYSKLEPKGLGQRIDYRVNYMRNSNVVISIGVPIYLHV